MDIKAKREVKGALGSAGSDANSTWWERAASWQIGANTNAEAIRAEARENNLKYGVPDDDSFPNPAANNSPDGPLPNPHNFSNNPGFMGGSISDALISGPANGGTATIRTSGGGGRSLPARSARASTAIIGRSPTMGHGNIAYPSAGSTDPRGDSGPQVVSSGYNG